MKVRFLLLFAVFLGGCATAPPPVSEDAVAPAAIARHQQHLAQLEQWQLQAHIALFNLTNDERDAVYLEWRQRPQQMQLRFYHPLKGTLARLEQTPLGATYYDEDDQAYYGSDAEQLVHRLFGYQLPLDLLQQVVIGQQPELVSAPSYRNFSTSNGDLAPLASYHTKASEQQWHVQLNAYEVVNSKVYLPTAIELESALWRIKMRVRKWQL